HQLSSQAASTYATVETLKKERATLDEVRGQLRKADSEVAQSIGRANTLKIELDQMRATAAALSQDYSRMRETSREAREDTKTALATARDVEHRLGPLTRLLEMSKSADERLASLTALAEHVAQQAKALESQQQAVEHAVVQANRVNEMVWAMDVQIAKLNEGMKQVARADETLARTEKLSAEADAHLEQAATLRQEMERDTGKLKKDATALLQTVREHVEALGRRKREFESIDERLRTLQSGGGDAESRTDG